MDKIELKVTMEPERLDALRYFLSGQEKSTPEKELQRGLDELYEKYVPADTRAYLDHKCKPSAARPKPRRPVKSSAPTAAGHGPMGGSASGRMSRPCERRSSPECAPVRLCVSGFGAWTGPCPMEVSGACLARFRRKYGGGACEDEAQGRG